MPKNTLSIIDKWKRSKLNNSYETRLPTYNKGRTCSVRTCQPNGDYIIYDFNKIITYLNVKGKLLFGGKFKIYPEDREILFSLCSYFIKDKSTCEKLGIDIHKGILLTGPVGCGKTSLIRLLKHIVPHQRPYEVIPTRNIVFGFNSIGYNIIEDYGNRHFIVLMI